MASAGTVLSTRMAYRAVALGLLALTLAGFAATGIAQSNSPFVVEDARAGVRFRIDSPNSGSINSLHLQIFSDDGLLDEVRIEVDGTVDRAVAEDLDDNGLPEIYVMVQSAGSGSYGTLIGYTLNSKYGLTSIQVPELTTIAGASEGYMGHDTFTVTKGAVVRSFPVYRPGDNNAHPSGGERRIQYRLQQNGIHWMLVPHNISHVAHAP